MNTEVENRFCTRRNTNTMHLIIVSGNKRYELPRATVIVPAIVAFTTFVLMMIY